MSQVQDFLRLTAASSRAQSQLVPEPVVSIPAVASRDKAQVSPQGARVALDQCVEFELRYAMPLSDVEQRVDLSRLPWAEITQNYFSRSHIPSLRLFAADLLEIPPSELEAFGITSARVRRTSRRLASGIELPTVYSLDLKGPKGSPESPGRLEISVPLSRARYERLLALADHGVISKLRYTIDGVVFPPGRSSQAKFPCKAEIDLLQYCGRGAVQKQPVCERYNFATIDLEVHSPAALKHALSGRHNFDFLNSGAVEFSSLSPKIQAALGNRRMSKVGIDAEVLKSLRTLRRSWQE